MHSGGSMRSILSITLLVGLLTLTACGKYAEGRDSYKSFGDGRIQLIKWYESETGHKYFSLINLEDQNTIDMKVQEYTNTNEILITFGEQGYTVLDLKTYRFKQDNELNILSHEEQTLLENMKDIN